MIYGVEGRCLWPLVDYRHVRHLELRICSLTRALHVRSFLVLVSTGSSAVPTG